MTHASRLKRFGKLRRGMIGAPYVAHLSFLDERVESAECFSNGNFGVRIMQLVEIDIICAQINKALLKHLAHISWGRALICPAVIHFVPDLCCDDCGITLTSQSAAKNSFRFSGREAIIIGSIEKVYSSI
ncbi:hypothetical protein D3C85_1283110 [compost metagenome]